MSSRENVMRKYLSATNTVLFLLCAVYLITYVDRVNISTAAGAMKGELHLNNTELGFAFSAFAYPYAVFQIIGGWVGDRFGARRTLFASGLIWASATILTGLAEGFRSLVLFRVLLGFGNAATPPIVAALIISLTWRGSFMVLGAVSLVWVLIWVWYFRDDPKDHPAITSEELVTLPPRKPDPRVRVPWR